MIEFQRATRPLLGMIEGFIAGAGKYGVDEEPQRYLRDVADHAITVAERVSGFRRMLHDILPVRGRGGFPGGVPGRGREQAATDRTPSATGEEGR